MSVENINRRGLLGLAGATVGAALLEACGGSTPTPAATEDPAKRQKEIQDAVDKALKEAQASAKAAATAPATAPAVNHGKVELERRITTKKDAVDLYGVDGEPSSKESFWVVNEKGLGGAKIPAESLTEEGTLIRLKPGAVLDGSIKQLGEVNDQLGIVGEGVFSSDGLFRIRGGTLWYFGVANAHAGGLQVFKQQSVDREPVEQPGVRTVYLCPAGPAAIGK